MRNTITENAVLLRLSFCRLGAVRKADKSEIQTDSDKDRLKLGKVLFVSPEYKAIQSYDNDLLAWVQSRAIPCNVGVRGVSVLPLALLDSVEKRFGQAKEDRAALVESFLSVYDSEREEGRRRLNGMFRESDYPAADVVRAAYSFSWSYLTFKTPDNLPDDVKAREADKLKAKFEEAEIEVREALRVGLSELVGHLCERLTPGPDGKRQIFRDSAVNNLVEFLEIFRARNVTGDDELQALCDKAQSVIRGVRPDALRDGRAVREMVRERLGEVKTAVDGLIASAPRRKFNLED